MGDFKIYFLNFVLLIFIPAYVIPNLSSDLSEYNYEIKTLEDSRIDVREYYKLFTKSTERTLVLIMTDKTEWYISRQYSDYWDELKSKNNIGKKYKLYLAFNTSYYYNPIQIEIEDDVVYGISVGLFWGYMLLILTIGTTVYSFLSLRRKYLSTNNDLTPKE